MACVLGIDVGTTAIKTVVIEGDGALGDVRSVGYGMRSARAGWFEQDADEMWGAICEAVRSAVGQRTVAGIGLSTQAAAVVLLDEDNEPTGPIVSWMDRRARDERKELTAELGEDYLRGATGLLSTGILGSLLRWMGKHEVKRLAKAARVSTVEDWLYRKLTGFGGTHAGNAAITGAMNLATLDWDERLVGGGGVDWQRLPAVKRSIETRSLRDDARRAFGIVGAGEIGVSAGAHDQQAAALGAGVMGSGARMLSTGTAWVLLAVGKRLGASETGGRFAAPLAGDEGKWSVLGALACGGGYYDQMLGMMGCGDYSEAEGLAGDAAVNVDGPVFVPSVGGERVARWEGWRLDIERGAVLRGVMEGLGFEALLESREMDRILGPAERVVMLGGAGHSGVWAQVIADVFGQVVEVPGVADAAAVGAALLGGKAAGWWAQVGEGRARLDVSVRRYDPDAGGEKIARERFERFVAARGR